MRQRHSDKRSTACKVLCRDRESRKPRKPCFSSFAVFSIIAVYCCVFCTVLGFLGVLHNLNRKHILILLFTAFKLTYYFYWARFAEVKALNNFWLPLYIKLN